MQKTKTKPTRQISTVLCTRSMPPCLCSITINLLQSDTVLVMAEGENIQREKLQHSKSSNASTSKCTDANTRDCTDASTYVQ
jgi:hypothetical protein